MAGNNEILTAARDLGRMIASHESTKKLAQVQSELEANAQTRQLLTDYNRHIQTLSEKQAKGQPIEVGDKRRTEQLRTEVAMNPMISRLQMAQMDYTDLLRRVNHEMMQAAGEAAEGPTVETGQQDVAGRIVPPDGDD